jgi:hypothetical protein
LDHSFALILSFTKNIHFKMKKASILGLFLLFQGVVFACDVCSIFEGIRPYDFNHRLGFWQRSRLHQGTLEPFQTRDLSKHLEEEESVFIGDEYREVYSSFELRGNYQINQRWSVFSLLPVVQRERTINQTLQGRSTGIGDPILMLRYAPVISKKTDKNSNFRHRLIGGFGLKFPLGETQKQYKGEVMDHDLQAGTGSYDFLAQFEYMAKYKRFGVLVNGMGRYNTTNLSGYQHGHVASLSVQHFFIIGNEKRSVLPFVGLYAEQLTADHEDAAALNNTGGQYLFASLGMEIQFKNVSLQGTWQHIIEQEQTGVQIPVLSQVQFGLSYMISK